MQSVLDLDEPRRYRENGICQLNKGEKTMQGMKGLIVVATIAVASAALGGCFGHHQKQVSYTPMKLGTAIEQPAR